MTWIKTQQIEGAVSMYQHVLHIRLCPCGLSHFNADLWSCGTCNADVSVYSRAGQIVHGSRSCTSVMINLLSSFDRLFALKHDKSRLYFWSQISLWGRNPKRCIPSFKTKKELFCQQNKTVVCWSACVFLAWGENSYWPGISGVPFLACVPSKIPC